MPSLFHWVTMEQGDELAILWVMADYERRTVRIDQQGRALIPKPMREALLRQRKARFHSVEGSMSEEIIRERREEARGEAAL